MKDNYKQYYYLILRFFSFKPFSVLVYLSLWKKVFFLRFHSFFFISLTLSFYAFNVYLKKINFSESGEPWPPTKHSKICGLHFEGGKKSEDPRCISYYPTIFPLIYRREHSKTALEREQRHQNRDMKKKGQTSITPSPGTPYEEVSPEELVPYPDFPTLRDASTQTEIQKNDVGTQTAIAIVPNTVTKVSVDVGPSEPYRPGFHGFPDVTTDSHMKQVTGISLAVFHVLLQFIIPRAEGRPKYFRTLNSENRLLLFLMKMKLGLAFSAIGMFFHISGQTASAIFESVLITVHEKKKLGFSGLVEELLKQQCRNLSKIIPIVGQLLIALRFVLTPLQV